MNQGNSIHYKETHSLRVKQQHPLEEQAGDQGLAGPGGDNSNQVPLQALQIALDL